MIPKLLHRVWLDDPMPPAFEGFGARWMELHPSWVSFEWRQSAQLETPLFRSFLPTYHRLAPRSRELFPRDWKRFIADVLRLELLYVYGGLYVDTDVEPLRNLEQLLEGERVLVGRSPQADAAGHHAITNCVMAAEPRHPYFAALLNGLEQAIAEHRGSTLARMVGPWHLDRTFAEDWERWMRDGVTVLFPEELFGAGWLTHYWNNARRKAGRGLG